MKTVYQNCLLVTLLFLSTVALAQVPVLNSYPSSNTTVYLDFDGHDVSGTSWNYNGDIICDESTLNTTQVTAIFNRISEDYRPFTLNITTDSTKYLSAPANKRMRVVFTTSSSWYGSAGGVAFINSFTWGDNTPCFVFTALLNNNTKYIAEAASHEIGHTLGLRHQSSYDGFCNKTSEYNYGRGTGEIGWAPIMGVGYYQNMTLWNYGANPFGCNNYQDDLSIITGNGNGINYRPDDFTSVVANAQAFSFINNAFTVNGIIERPDDADVMKFIITEPGRFRLDATPYSSGTNNSGSNVDIEVQLVNNIQSIIGSYNHDATLNTSIDTLLDAGIYYFIVKGKGNIYAPDYASLGSYTLLATFVASSSLPLHKLQLKGAVENKQHKLGWEIIADENIVTQTLETSANGRNFQRLSSFAAATRSHHYPPSANSIVYYRLKVMFDNGREYYSNPVALRSNGSNSKPYLIGNVITRSLTIHSPLAYSYTINDMTGRTVAKGILSQGVNTVHPAFFTNGIYIIQYQNGAELHTEKFTRQ